MCSGGTKFVQISFFQTLFQPVQTFSAFCFQKVESFGKINLQGCVKIGVRERKAPILQVKPFQKIGNTVVFHPVQSKKAFFEKDGKDHRMK